MSNIPGELPSHDGAKCSYACWSTSPREVSNSVAYGVKPTSRWARDSYQVDLVSNVILGCDCDDDGFCRHIQHIIEMDTRGCMLYNPISDPELIAELKEFTRTRRKVLYDRLLATQ